MSDTAPEPYEVTAAVATAEEAAELGRVEATRDAELSAVTEAVRDAIVSGVPWNAEPLVHDEDQAPEAVEAEDNAFAAAIAKGQAEARGALASGGPGAVPTVDAEDGVVEVTPEEVTWAEGWVAGARDTEPEPAPADNVAAPAEVVEYDAGAEVDGIA